jgi:hypothetical protein
MREHICSLEGHASLTNDDAEESDADPSSEDLGRRLAVGGRAGGGLAACGKNTSSSTGFG